MIPMDARMGLGDILAKALEAHNNEHNEIKQLREEIVRCDLENARFRSMLFPYADETQISGSSWNGFYLIGDKKSIKELDRIRNDATQIEVYRKAYDEGLLAAKHKNERLRAKLNAVRLAIKGKEDDA